MRKTRTEKGNFIPEEKKPLKTWLPQNKTHHKKEKPTNLRPTAAQQKFFKSFFSCCYP